MRVHNPFRPMHGGRARPDTQ
ncbi:unnamed protein product [Acanthoscelides obtectus]|uniref:Uncharacterized protein n=1 Tax=Acanthoscelides obtectus TaxID=200917 RepID=A0A9P0LUC5_ACAOB|nr:unnamed protein product [Acanthoscelides obtectus]CAK1641071.1 hypothetical protein AOBTE_LOCUS12126 [Acanthoscelides obtectus]